MAKPKPVIIDGEYKIVQGNSLADIVSPEVTSISTAGKLIPRSEFDNVPIPVGFETHLSPIEKGAR